VAITNSGVVYIGTTDLGGYGLCGYLLRLDPSTGLVTNPLPYSSGCYTGEGGDSMVSTADGTRIFINDGGGLAYIDTASGQVTLPINSNNYLEQPGFEIDLSPTQTRLFANAFFFDANFNSIGMQMLNTAEGIDADYLSTELLAPFALALLCQWRCRRISELWSQTTKIIGSSQSQALPGMASPY
jgi:hypothetical protein